MDVMYNQCQNPDLTNSQFFESHKNSFQPKDIFHHSVKHCTITPDFLNYTILKPIFISLEGTKKSEFHYFNIYPT